MEFSAGACIRFGWETFKKRPWFFVGTGVLIAIISWAISFLSGSSAVAFGNETTGGVLSFIVSFILQTFLGMGIIALYLKAHTDVMGAQVGDLWHPEPFLKYIGATILMSIVVMIGFVLLIIPGIIASLVLMFTTYLVIDKNLGPIEAIQESRRITKGHLGKLFIFALALIGINILGAICLGVGLLVSMPVSSLAIVQAYRVLSAGAAAPAAPAAGPAMA